MEGVERRMNENFSKKIDFFSFIGSLFVVWSHMTYVASEDIVYVRIATKYVSTLVAMAMGYFFFMSGYLFYRNYDLSKTLQKWKSRVKSLLIPYFFWNALAFVVLVVLKIIGLARPWTWFLDINKLADGPLWYVLSIMIYMMLAPLIFYIIRNKYRFWLFLTGLVALDVIVDFGALERYLYYLPIFVFGAGIAIHYMDIFEHVVGNDENAKSGNDRWIKGVCSFLMLSIVYCGLSYIECSWGYRIFRIIIRITAPILIFYLFRKCKVDNYCKFWKCSFFLYCAHEIVNDILIQNKWVQYVFNHYYWAKYTVLGFTLYAIIVVVLVGILYLGTKKYMPKVWTIICGGR